jgi:hypothetical protein
MFYAVPGWRFHQRLLPRDEKMYFRAGKLRNPDKKIFIHGAPTAITHIGPRFDTTIETRGNVRRTAFMLRSRLNNLIDPPTVAYANFMAGVFMALRCRSMGKLRWMAMFAETYADRMMAREDAYQKVHGANLLQRSHGDDDDKANTYNTMHRRTGPAFTAAVVEWGSVPAFRVLRDICREFGGTMQINSIQRFPNLEIYEEIKNNMSAGGVIEHTWLSVTPARAAHLEIKAGKYNLYQMRHLETDADAFRLMAAVGFNLYVDDPAAMKKVTSRIHSVHYMTVLVKYMPRDLIIKYIRTCRRSSPTFVGALRAELTRRKKQHIDDPPRIDLTAWDCLK